MQPLNPAVPWRWKTCCAARIDSGPVSTSFDSYRTNLRTILLHGLLTGQPRAYTSTFGLGVLGVSLVWLDMSHPPESVVASVIRGWPIDVADRHAASDHTGPDSAVMVFARAAYVDLAKSKALGWIALTKLLSLILLKTTKRHQRGDQYRRGLCLFSSVYLSPRGLR